MSILKSRTSPLGIYISRSPLSRYSSDSLPYSPPPTYEETYYPELSRLESPVDIKISPIPFTDKIIRSDYGKMNFFMEALSYFSSHKYSNICYLKYVWEYYDTLKIKGKYIKCDKRFNIIPVYLKDSQYHGHMNTLFVDNHLKIIELFDPWGSEKQPVYSSDAYKAILKKTALEIFQGYKFVDMDITCPSISFQSMKTDKKLMNKMKKILNKKSIGFCVAWNIFYIDMRLKYPNYKPKKLQEAIKQKIDNPTMFIMNYINYLTSLINYSK